jgi:hypothetical protein
MFPKNHTLRFLFYIGVFLLLLSIFQVLANRRKVETFTPKMREFYRPYLREARLHLEDFSNNYNINHLVNKLKKNGLY